MSGILPIEQWRNGEQLVDPMGFDYDPNSPPSLIGFDAVLGPAIQFGRENARRIGVTVLCGLQTEAADLGKPGEFEEHLRRADLVGNYSFGQDVEPGTEGYQARIERAFISEAHAKPRSFTPFNLMDWRLMEQSDLLGTIQRMEAVIEIASGTLSMAQSLDLGSLGKEDELDERSLDVIAGRVHVANHLNWLVVGSICDQAKMLAELPGIDDYAERIAILVDETPFGVDVARKFGALGINAGLHQYRRNAWPEEVVSEILDFGSIMATGRIDAVY